MRRALLLALLTSLVLAGCTTDTGTGDGSGDGGTGAGSSQPLTQAQAQSLLSEAGSGMPDRYGMDMTMTKAGAEVLTMKGAFDNATGEAYIRITMDPTVLQTPGDDSAGFDQAAALFAQGFALYMTTGGTVYIVNDTAFTFPASESGENSFVPSPDDSPFGEFLKPDEAFGELDENVTIHSVRPITHKGKAAAEIEATLRGDENESTNATIIVYRDPARLARISSDLPQTSDDGEADPLGGAHAVVDLLYDSEVEITVPERATRAAGLLYKSDGSFGGFGGSGGPTTWTFQNAGGIPLADVEVQAKDVSAMGEEQGSLDALAQAPTLWSMTLSDGTRTEGGVTVTFTDADGDGKVGPGDTLSYSGEDENGMPPQLVLYDTVSGTYVVPGPGLFLAALALAGVALLLRRK